MGVRVSATGSLGQPATLSLPTICSLSPKTPVVQCVLVVIGCIHSQLPVDTSGPLVHGNGHVSTHFHSHSPSLSLHLFCLLYVHLSLPLFLPSSFSPSLHFPLPLSITLYLINKPSWTKKSAVNCMTATACSEWLVAWSAPHSNPFFSGCH